MDIPSAQRSQKRISFWAFSLISLLLYTLIAMHFSFFKKMMLLNFLHLSFQRMAIKYCQFAFGKLLLIVLFLSDRWSSQSAEASPPGITFDDVSSEDYSSVLGEQEPTKPDDVDNEVIQSLVDNFLNRGSVSGGNDADGGAKASAEPAKLNKEAQALVNSSDYWRIDNLKSMHSISDPDEVRKWLNGYSAELQKILQQIALAGWNYFTSASYSTKQYLDEAEEVGRTFLRATAKQSGQFNASAFPYGSAERLQLSVLAQQGMNALDSVDLQEFNRILLAINQQFTHTQLCGEPGKAPMGGDKTACLLKFTDIPALLDAPSADATQCLELWQKWRLAAGQNLSASYAQLVHLSNKGARLNGFADTGAMWRAVYELPGEQYGFQPGRQLDMVQQLDLLFAQLRPLYEQLHAYFRSRLAALHSKKGNEEMNGYDDYRIKVCGQLSEADFVNAHRLMAKLYYQYSSRQQPILLRDAPNPSLSSAMAGAFGIIALNPDYLRAQRLIGEQVERSGPAEINRLYKEALEEVVKLPFAIVADKWRYAVFEGRLSAGNWSEEWWRLRQKYQGVKAPSMANPLAAEFDPVASPAITQMHAPAARDALAYVAQFQVLKKLCGGINQISQGCLPTKNALESVRDAISKGGSISWLDAFEKLTGSRQLDAGPLLEYYEPLLEWLKNTNENEQRVIGWESGKDEPFQENELPELHGEYQNDSGAQFGTGLMGISSEDGGNIAFPGQSCEKGQECLLDSQCNGTICVCREGLYTLKIADSYNCVPGDPAKVGFTDDNGGLVIALNDRDRMTMTANGTEGTSPSDVQNDGNDVNGDHMHQMDGQQPKASSATPNRTRITQWLWMTMSLLILFF